MPVLRSSPVARRISPAIGIASSPGDNADSYLDYRRLLTPEGGVLIIYRDIDERFRFTLWRILAWSVASGLEGWYLCAGSPVESWWVNGLCGLAVAALNALIVWAAIPVQRRIEIKPDCLILEGREVFWRSGMDAGAPCLQPIEDKEDAFSFCGTYGTRLVKFGILRRFDEFDRQPEVFAAHVQQAFEQLWEGTGRS